MVLRLSHRFDSGQFADVFRTEGRGRVIKLYRRVPTPQEDREGRGAFRREQIAYTNVMRFVDLRPHVPEFFGTPQISDVLEEDGRSVANRYHLDSALELAFIEGECRKFYELPGERIAVELLQRFDGRVAYDYDCSFFNWSDPKRIIVIDFAPTL